MKQYTGHLLLICWFLFFTITLKKCDSLGKNEHFMGIQKVGAAKLFITMWSNKRRGINLRVTNYI